MQQKFLIFFGLITMFFISSCGKHFTPFVSINIEQFRRPDMSDYELLQRMVDSLPENSNIKLANKTYIIDHTIIETRSHNFYGPATFKRENQIIYKLTQPATSSSTYLVLDHTAGLRVPDRFLLTTGTNAKHTTQIDVVKKISGDTIFLNNPIGKTVGLQSDFPVGATLFKNINFFWIVDPYEYPRQKCSFNNIIFDGNRNENKGSHSWLLNASIVALTKGPTVYLQCTFINSPAETILGHNADIRECIFKNLNGSAFHTSADRIYNTEEEVHSYLSGNHFENTNEVLTTIGGHSEGCITHSNSGGYYTAVNNTFVNVGESVLGALYPSQHVHDWGTSNIQFSDNIIRSPSRMVYLIDTTTVGTIKNVRIVNNKIQELNPKDWSKELERRPDIIIENKVNQ